ncbi:MAG: hypothetical protein NC301_07700 [Bacteroides sp.]|nr:hypothetical protein [Bacteroides sp.]MCM1380034.1 hypothetical protein [Bacteroides sp.]MCM1446371.1 hypothetical protein [Prevotella sp.]
MKGIITNTQTGDLLIGRNKQATITDCEEQVCESVLLAMRGEFKEFPLLGAEVRQQLGGCVDPFWPQETKKMLRACKVAAETVKLQEDGSLTIQ